MLSTGASDGGLVQRSGELGQSLEQSSSDPTVRPTLSHPHLFFVSFPLEGNQVLVLKSCLIRRMMGEED